MENLNNSDIQQELDKLDLHQIPVDGVFMKPSQCYHLETDPLHVLFNTNCPGSLRKAVTSIIKKYYPDYETGVQQ